MTIDFKKFLEELAAFMASAAGVEFAGTPRALFIAQLVEADSTLAASPTPAPASVLRPYGGATPYVPTTAISIQCATTSVGGDDAGGLAVSALLNGTLCDSQKRPLRMLALPSFRINGILNLTAPAQVFRDSKDRAVWVFNFDAQVVPTA